MAKEAASLAPLPLPPPVQKAQQVIEIPALNRSLPVHVARPRIREFAGVEPAVAIDVGLVEWKPLEAAQLIPREEASAGGVQPAERVFRRLERRRSERAAGGRRSKRQSRQRRVV